MNSFLLVELWLFGVPLVPLTVSTSGSPSRFNFYLRLSSPTMCRLSHHNSIAADDVFAGVYVLQKVEKMVGREDYRIFVGGLGWNTSQRHLEDEFARYGKIIDCLVSSFLICFYFCFHPVISF